MCLQKFSPLTHVTHREKKNKYIYNISFFGMLGHIYGSACWSGNGTQGFLNAKQILQPFYLLDRDYTTIFYTKYKIGRLVHNSAIFKWRYRRGKKKRWEECVEEKKRSKVFDTEADGGSPRDERGRVGGKLGALMVENMHW